MNLAKRKNGIYYVQYFDEKDNRVRRISTGEKLKKNALIFISEFRAQNKINGRLQYISLRNFRDEYIEYIKKTFSKKYLSSVELSFRLLIRFTNDLPLKQIETRSLDRFFGETFKRTQKGAELYFRTLKAAFNKAIDWKYINENPFIKIQLPKSSQSFPVFITESELNQILVLVNESNLRDLFRTAFFTGMRLGELTHLKWSDIDFNNNRIAVRNDIFFNTKNRKDRIIPMNKKLQLVLQIRANNNDEINPSEYVFIITKGVKLNDDYVSKYFKKIIRKSLLDDKIHFHSLRHSFASNLVQKGASIYVVKQLLGHSDVRTTQIYSHLSPRNFEEVVNIL